MDTNLDYLDNPPLKMSLFENHYNFAINGSFEVLLIIQCTLTVEVTN